MTRAYHQVLRDTRFRPLPVFSYSDAGTDEADQQEFIERVHAAFEVTKFVPNAYSQADMYAGAIQMFFGPRETMLVTTLSGAGRLWLQLNMPASFKPWSVPEFYQWVRRTYKQDREIRLIREAQQQELFNKLAAMSDCV